MQFLDSRMSLLQLKREAVPPTSLTQRQPRFQTVAHESSPFGRTGPRAHGSLAPGSSVTQFRAALDSIEEHRDAAVTVRDLAAVVHLSPSPFARTFPAPTGLPPHRSVVARPIERAKQFQRGGDDFSLAQVAAPGPGPLHPPFHAARRRRPKHFR